MSWHNAWPKQGRKVMTEMNEKLKKMMEDGEVGNVAEYARDKASDLTTKVFEMLAKEGLEVANFESSVLLALITANMSVTIASISKDKDASMSTLLQTQDLTKTMLQGVIEGWEEQESIGDTWKNFGKRNTKYDNSLAGNQEEKECGSKSMQN